jgi:imidazole glycerol-phosphate synthase subunit HisF
MTSINRVIATLLIEGGRAVKTRKFDQRIHLGDPINIAKIFNDYQVDELLLLDIGRRSEYDRPYFELIESIVSEMSCPVTYGGGLRNYADAAKAFDTGIEKISLKSLLESDLRAISKIAKNYGSQSVSACIDYCGTFEDSQNDSEESDNLLAGYMAKLSSAGIGEFIFQSIDRDGMKSGIDQGTVRFVSAQTQKPCVFMGGASSIQDIREAFKNGAAAVAVGALFSLYGPCDAPLFSYYCWDSR